MEFFHRVKKRLGRPYYEGSGTSFRKGGPYRHDASFTVLHKNKRCTVEYLMTSEAYWKWKAQAAKHVFYSSVRPPRGKGVKRLKPKCERRTG